MTLLILSYILGYDKSVRVGVWTILGMTFLGGSLSLLMASPTSNSAYAASEKVVYLKQDVVYYLEKLSALEKTHDTSGFYQGNNLEFTELFAHKLEGYSHEKQLKKLQTIINGFKMMDPAVLKTTRKIDTESLLIVYEDILERSSESRMVTTEQGKIVEKPYNGTLIDDERAKITYQVSTYQGKKLVTFYSEPVNGLKQMTWHFGDGETIGCAWGQCTRIYHLYEENKDYELMIFANTKLSDGWSEIFTFNPWEHDDIERLPTKVEEKTSTVTVLEVEQTESEEEQEEVVNEEDDMEFDEDIEDDLDFIQSFLGIDL